MTVLTYSFAWLAVITVVGMLATVGIWFLAFASLIVVLVAAFVAVIALGWGLALALRPLGRRLS